MAIALKDTFTSTGAKFHAHQEAMTRLRNGQGQPITTHIMPCDVCQHQCAFCSVQTREGNTLLFSTMRSYLETLVGYGLKAVIISGGGNPILYRCPETKAGFNELVAMIRGFGLEIGCITNGMPLREYEGGRRSWRNVSPEMLDELTWVRISMAGLDHKEQCVYVPDVDPDRTTLGFSYVLHDIYTVPEEPNHGKVSTEADLIPLGGIQKVTGIRWAKDRIPELTEQIRSYVLEYRPRYVRCLPNCLQPDLLPSRCKTLQDMANQIDPNVVFVQYKPPNPHTACWLGYIHPVLNSDGWIYPCDSVTLNTDVREPGQHDFGSAWRVCRWDEVSRLYDQPIKSLIDDPKKRCPGCVFGTGNSILDGVVKGTEEFPPPLVEPEHVNFI